MFRVEVLIAAFAAILLIVLLTFLLLPKAA